jgi:asparagine synthase (glutamine-hydrolysing)
MCGIAGIAYSDRDRAVSPSLLKAMTDSISHRGPDDEGFHFDGGVGLGHRRLSIIDLSTGRQPIPNEDGTCHIVFNGEIYNYKELRKDLVSKGHVFATQTDTEVIVHCYEEYGEDCVRRLNGMFAFAIWDARERKLFLARDHLGIKPLFFYADAEKILFGSELKALLAYPDLPRKLDTSAMDAYFSYMYIPDPLTVFGDVKKLPSAHTLTYQNGKVSIRRFWDARNDGRIAKSERAWTEELTALLEDSVKKQLMSDVPLGVFLSGGIDSSSVVGMMAKFTDSIQTFSMAGGPGLFNELPYAREVARRYGTKHHELDVPTGNIQELLPKLVGYLDEPFSDSSIIPTYHICKQARANVKVVLSGEGGDEIFAGYTWHKKFLQVERFKDLIPEAVRRGVLKPGLTRFRGKGRLGRMARTLASANEFSLMPPGQCFETLRRIFSRSIKQQIYGQRLAMPAEAEIWAIKKEYDSNQGLHPLDNALYADRLAYLTGDLLTKVDRMSMANSLEVRVPLLDYRIVELAAGIPPHFKLNGSVSKYIFRQSMDDVLPDLIKKRKIKRGFSVPVNDWFKEGMREYAYDLLLDGRTKDRGFFRTEGTRKLLDDHVKGSGHHGDQIFSMVIFELWARRHLDHRVSTENKEESCQQSLSTVTPTTR